MRNAKIKICGLNRIEDVEYVNELKPDYCGFIINFPQSHRSLSPEQVRELSVKVDRGITRVGVFVNQPVELIIELLNDDIIDIAQLHGNETENDIIKIKRDTRKEVIKAFKISNKYDLRNALISVADYILLDQGYGEGKTFDWEVIDWFAKWKLQKKKWFLAGGLNEENIETAILTLDPYAIDVSSSVETEKVKDYSKIKRTIDIVRKGKKDE